MKGGAVSKSEAFDTGDQSMVCGVLSSSGGGGGIAWNGDWAFACDFHGGRSMSETSKFADKIAAVRAPPIKVALTLLGRTTTEGRVGLKAEPHLKAMHSILEI